MTINNASVYEGNSGTKTLTFTVILSSSPSGDVTVDYATAGGTATAGSDYVATSGSLSFAAGVRTRDIIVTINGDTVDEANETYFVNLTNASSNASISDSQGQGTIQNDDHPIAPPSGLNSWWPGDGSANDIAGTSNGTVAGGLTYAPGLVDQAFQFNGIDAAVDAGNAPPLQVSAGDFTVETWVFFQVLSHPPGANSPAGDMSLVDKMSANGIVNSDGWRLLKQNDNHFWFGFGGGTSNGLTPTAATTVISASTATIGTWYHVVAVKNSTAFALYVNGVQEASKPTPTFTDTQSTDLLLGANAAAGGGAHLNGLLDEVAIYNRALSAAEIQSIYDAGPAGKIKQPLILISTYSNTTVRTIPDGGTTTATIVVAAGGTILDVNVKINVTHTSDADLDIFLIAPNGKRVELTTDNGGTGDNYTNTVFDDEATTAITAGTAPFSATYRPEGSLSALDGASVTGTWTLEISDDTKGQKGKLNSWSLRITRGVAPSSPLVAAGSFALGATTTAAFETSALAPIVQEAIVCRQAVELSAAQLGRLTKVENRIANLGGATLGLGSGNTITLDSSAVGLGWFAGRSWRRGRVPQAGRMDLHSALTTRLGHLLDLSATRAV